jgi:hypothetical protein
MSSADKAKLDAATAAATANAIALRDANGRVSVGTPTTATHAATMAYVDGQTVATANYVDQQVGPNGLTVRDWTIGTIAGFTVSGKIQSVPFANKTLVTGNVVVLRPAGATPYTVNGGGNTVFAWLGNIIPTEIRQAGAVDIATVTNLAGGAASAKIQTNVQPSTGRVGVRADDAGGLSWGPNAQLSVHFSYYVETVVA